jgi:DNA-binding NarL/FixJ family response regulator
MPTFTVVVADDYEPFRRIVRSILQRRADLQVIAEASEGLEAVQKAKALHPDLIVLDIGLPILNGIQVARRLREIIPLAKCLFLSVESSSDIVGEALKSGAGYVHKLRTQNDLLPAIDAVLEGKRFVSRGLEASHRHEVHFCSDDSALLASATSFIADALKVGDVAITVFGASHRAKLLQQLRAGGIDIDAAVRSGSYISFDVNDLLPIFMVNDWPDSVRFFEAVSSLITQAKQKDRRVVACGECSPTLWAQGKVEATVQLEHFWDEVARTHDLDILCVYPLPQDRENDAFNRLCAEHSAVSFR